MKKRLNLFLAIASLSFVVLSLNSCSFGFTVIKPEGEYISKTIETNPFENVSVSSGMELILTQDPTTSVRVETYENIHQYIKTEVTGNTLDFTIDFTVNLLNPKVKVYVNKDKINRISGSGGSRLNLNSGWSADNLEVSMSGGSSAFGKVEAKDLSVSMSGGSRSELEGSAEKLTLDASGGSSCRNFNLAIIQGNMRLSGGASAHITASDFLSVEGSGGASVQYKGNPELRTNLSGGATVRKAD
ncbi:MAG: DUF2807 domain-containing protein [Bacteroidales bacterium]|nr:DUF2807 domain-containing protein [Bacteroidales bacterium]MDD2424406.1 DUF2807 domain-containing protein [Bacteroidales bacterium]MDD3988988.1 DUF2807 domain-containing protein [Bacteroidales bacterium]MDD4638304.1 DUF2807 domain-containing protein [Bacteroidales bacterium]